MLNLLPSKVNKKSKNIKDYVNKTSEIPKIRLLFELKSGERGM